MVWLINLPNLTTQWHRAKMFKNPAIETLCFAGEHTSFKERQKEYSGLKNWHHRNTAVWKWVCGILRFEKGFPKEYCGLKKGSQRHTAVWKRVPKGILRFFFPTSGNTAVFFPGPEKSCGLLKPLNVQSLWNHWIFRTIPMLVENTADFKIHCIESAFPRVRFIFLVEQMLSKNHHQLEFQEIVQRILNSTVRFLSLREGQKIQCSDLFGWGSPSPTYSVCHPESCPCQARPPS